MPKRNQNKTFEEQITRVFEREAVCDVCKEDTDTFQATDRQTHKRMIKEYPLNKEHRETYRQNFEFMLNDDVWNKTMGKNNLYICLECWERDYLTPVAKGSRKTNEFGFCHVIPEDLQLGNPVNIGVDEFFKAIAETKQEKDKDVQHKKDVAIIGKHDMEHGFDD
jgi:hypothetical protein